MKNAFIASGVLFALLFLSQPLFSQRFKLGVTAGLNMSQVNGDHTGGYNKLGLVGGLRGIAILTEKAELSMELTYSQRGSRNDQGEHVTLQLNYVEVPFLFNYKDWYIEEGEYYKVQVSGGFAFSRLLKAVFDDKVGLKKDVTEDLFKNDIALVLGADFFFNAHWSLGGRWTTSVNNLATAENSPIPFSPKHNLRGYFLSFRVNYIF